MKDPKPLRVMSLLARVRKLRVERKRHELNDARDRAERAAADTQSQQDAIDEHGQRRLEILSACRRDLRVATLWRGALHRHDSGNAPLEQALFDARKAEEIERENVNVAFRALQREMRARDDVQERVRRLKVEQQMQDETED